MCKRTLFFGLTLVVLSVCFFTNSPVLAADTGTLYLKRATGDLEIYGQATDSTYEAYFHIPIAFENQVPIHLDIISPDLIDYRFVHLTPPNVLVAARLRRNTDITELTWYAWVIIKGKTSAEIPDEAPMSALENLPDSLKQWFQPTACVQLNEPMITGLADQLRGSQTNLMNLATLIHDHCARTIPFGFGRDPFTLDAWYALNWGNSCTGHSHAASALFRANGVPSRNLMNILTWVEGPFDMHWFNDYYVPGYGWVQMDPTSRFMFKCLPQDAVITYVCYPEDEFPLFFTRAIEGRWHSSDPALGCPDWGGAHYAYDNIAVKDSTDKINQSLSLAREVLNQYTKVHGIRLDALSQAAYEKAVGHQTNAYYRMRVRDISGFMDELQLALAQYDQISLNPIEDVFFDDFEMDNPAWISGGVGNEWEWGAPALGPETAWSGTNCRGTDLDDTYENNVSSWLQSPEIDLSGLNSAFLKFKIWNRVDDVNFQHSDYLWLDISTNGADFVPLCSQIIGGHDDTAVPDVPGWNSVTLDLTKYIGESVNVRFRFESDENLVQPGTYLDDVRVYGRKMSSNTSVADQPTQPRSFALELNYPNPFNGATKIEYELAQSDMVSLVILNPIGQQVAVLEDSRQAAGHYAATWHPSANVGSGVYFYKLTTSHGSQLHKCLYLK